VALLRAAKGLRSSSLEGEEQSGVTLVHRALEEAIRQIANNAGAEGSVVVEKVKDQKGGFGFNARQESMRI